MFTIESIEEAIIKATSIEAKNKRIDRKDDKKILPVNMIRRINGSKARMIHHRKITMIIVEPTNMTKKMLDT